MKSALKFLLIILLSILTLNTYSEVFTVTSNADSGTGTLREALQKAADNGNLEKDFIYFNLPDLSEAGRTILLNSELPELTSNIEIDGGTQKGLNFGLSSAKIGISYIQTNNSKLSGLRIYNKEDIFIGGIFLKNTIDFDKTQTSLYCIGIDIRRSKNIQIGASNRGNVVSGFANLIMTNNRYSETVDSTFNITIKSNLIGLEADGATSSLYPNGITEFYKVYNKIIVGGSNGEGNTIINGLSISYNGNKGNYKTDILIKGNNIGVNFFADEVLGLHGLDITNGTLNSNETIKIEDNVISNLNGDAIHIYDNQQDVTILRNYIGTNKSKTKVFKTGGIFIYSCKRVNVGSDNIIDANYITNCNPITIWSSSNISVNQNSFYCLKNVAPMYNDATANLFHPTIEILNSTTTSVSGIATPNSKIELFYTDKCNTCSPENYFASIFADAEGKWSYNGSLKNTVIASATLNNSTSNFTVPEINVTNIKVISNCDGTGSITGITLGFITSKRWVNERGETVGVDTNLKNATPGYYQLIVEYGTCTTVSKFYEIGESIKLNESSIKITPICGDKLGSVKGLFFRNSALIKTQIWKDQNGKEWSKDLDLIDVPSGVYTYYITLEKGCETISQQYIVNEAVPPIIDQSITLISNSTCSQSNGSIKNIKVIGSGILNYTWKNQSNQIVGSSKDLINQPAGKYILEVKDESSCGPIYSSEFEIKEINGISSNQNSLKITAANCNKSNGSIAGLIISGATTYQWFNEAKQAVGNNLDLTGQPPGKYTLIANNENCVKDFGPFTIDLVTQKNYGIPNNTVLFPTCGEINGTIEVNFKTDIAPSKYDWRKIGGASLNINSNKITNLDIGKYSLFLIDENGCEQFINTYEVKAGRPSMAIVNNSWKTTADNCGTATGSISGIRFNYENGPNDFSWFNDKGDVVSNERDLKNAKSGNYRLLIKNQYCGNTFDFYIPYKEEFLPQAIVSDIFICAPTVINLNIKEIADSYFLYDESGKLVSQSSKNQMNLKMLENKRFALTYKLGNCESEKAYFNVNIGTSSISVPSAFTPNDDGVNDFWTIKGLELYNSAKVSIFNRYGQEVFKHQGGFLNFDGIVNGTKLQTGTYYYVIKLSEDCSPLSGSVMIVN
ncbi:hypothetical protein A5893_01505 [Pedobacter psychrophilus]|uniref:Ig-like domain-containing protein n=1 Tax=Pedobacter psychrophilus TaxID=1826909 RepID=A0A179DM73_9SPHI|nr:gliding motility-associated C-terminal domain-containing protein [Pedobacter psychrophilus]OAQ41820.1 hypothetical protein A5893_01505 [Pedobacter psychrophilus]